MGPMSTGRMLRGGHGCKLCAYSSTHSSPPGGRFPLPFIETGRPGSQAPRQQAQTPSLRLGRRLPGPRRTGMPARQRARTRLARRVMSSSPSAAHHRVRTLCRKTAQKGSLVPVSPVCCTPRAGAIPRATCSPLSCTVEVCGSSKSGAGAQERYGAGCFGLLPPSQPGRHRAAGEGWCSPCAPTSSWKSPLQPAGLQLSTVKPHQPLTQPGGLIIKEKHFNEAAR